VIQRVTSSRDSRGWRLSWACIWAPAGTRCGVSWRRGCWSYESRSTRRSYGADLEAWLAFADSHDIPADRANVLSVAFSSGGRTLASGADDGAIRVGQHQSRVALPRARSASPLTGSTAGVLDLQSRRAHAMACSLIVAPCACRTGTVDISDGLIFIHCR
jgi:WD40 repeat protein